MLWCGRPRPVLGHPPNRTGDSLTGVTDLSPPSRLSRLSRGAALLVVALSYVVAGLAGFATVAVLPGMPPLAAAFWGDLVAPLVIFGLSMVLGNASLYAPYWSVAPPVIALAWLAVAPGGVGLRQLLVT